MVKPAGKTRWFKIFRIENRKAGEILWQKKLRPSSWPKSCSIPPAYAADKSADVKKAAADFAEGYRKFLDNGKTEREVAAESEQMLKDAGYQLFDPKKTYAPGDKVYFIQLNKAVVASTIGTRPYEEGFHLVIAHTDSPRLDLRPNPLYESDHFSYFKTHYYGGIRKYQWGHHAAGHPRRVLPCRRHHRQRECGRGRV